MWYSTSGITGTGSTPQWTINLARSSCAASARTPNTTAGRSNMAHGNNEHPPAGIRVIRSRADNNKMRRELDRLLDLAPPKGSPDRDRLDVLLVLLADYEAREIPEAKVDPVDAILFRMD